MRKFVLFSLCFLCIACQQQNEVNRAQLRGNWQDTDNLNCYYEIYSFNSFKITYINPDGTICVVPFNYEFYNNQLIASTYYKDLDLNHLRSDYMFNVIWNCSIQGDSLLYLTLKTCTKDNDYEDPCGWTPQKRVKLLRYNNEHFEYHEEN